MGRATFEVADVIRLHGESFLDLHGAKLSARQRAILQKIAKCRTAALGGHVAACDRCGHRQISYNSCRDRHCPKCLGSASAAWFRARAEDLLPVPYFHLVFTLPHELAPVAQTNRAAVYALLLRSSAESLLQVAAYPRPLGARIGFFGVLHTWSQTLEFHPHVHFVVPAGGISLDGERWIPCRKNFLVPVRVLRDVFRAKFLSGLQRLRDQGKLVCHGSLESCRRPDALDRSLRTLRKKKWVVYAKPPFGGPEQVLKYLARYTHRVAISNHRLLDIDESGVTFRWKDYAAGAKKRSMTLTGPEFLRRFLLHVLPKGFVRIRHFGFLAHRNRTRSLERCRTLIAEADAIPIVPPSEANEILAPRSDAQESHPRCPACKQGRMIEFETLEPTRMELIGAKERAPP